MNLVVDSIFNEQIDGQKARFFDAIISAHIWLLRVEQKEREGESKTRGKICYINNLQFILCTCNFYAMAKFHYINTF